MREVVAWPGPKETGHVGLYYRMPNKQFDPKAKVTPQNKPEFLAGRPFTDVDQLVRYAGTTRHVLDFKHVYFCTSRQAKQGLNKRGTPKAYRNAKDALAMKAIWIDIDVDANDPKKYPNKQTAWSEFTNLRKTLNLPNPSAVVDTGGGLHIYWTSKTPLLPHEWHAYADGLKQLLLLNDFKFDPICTADGARILRMPGTFNRKYDPAPEAQLLPIKLTLYDFAILDFLKQHAGQGPARQAQAHQLFAEAANANSFKAGPAFKIEGEPGLEAGIGRFGVNLLDPLPIFQRCGLYKEAALTGGKDYSQTLWMLSVLGTTFMEKGDEIAHTISKGHATYTPDDTTAMYDRKLAERNASGTLGYPSCAAFAGAGCKSCATCSLLGKVKSPLNIRPEVTATVNPASEELSQTETSFVDPYADFVGTEFPLDILPPTLASFVNSEHRAMGADPSAIAMAALTAVAGAIHAETQVRVGDGWWEKPIFWTSLVGQPSSMKSPILKKVTEPLSRIDHQRDKRWRQEYADWKKLPNNKTIASPPKTARCVLNDATPEKVAEVVSRDPSGSLMVQDELAGWLGGFERYSTGQSSRAFYLTSWNGGIFLKDRVGKGTTDPDAEIRVDNLALSILGGIQPDRLMKLGDLTSDGLLQRFLAVLMKPAKCGNPDYPVEAVEAEYENLIKSINALPARNYHFADEASEVRGEVLGYLHRLEQVDGFSPSLIGAIGKLKGYFARICLTLHIVRTQDPLVCSDINFVLADAFRILDPSECLSAGVNVNAAISRDVAEAAKKLLLEFSLPHMMGLYDVVVNGGQERDKLRSIANFILASDKDRLRPSDFTAGVRSLRGEPEQKIREWVGRFCSMDWLSPEEGKPGVPPKAWKVSEGLRQHFAQHRKQAQEAKAEMHAILKAGGSRRSP